VSVFWVSVVLAGLWWVGSFGIAMNEPAPPSTPKPIKADVPPTNWPEPGPSSLGFAFGAQILALIASGFFALAFLSRQDPLNEGNRILKPGLGPTLLQFPPLWLALLGGIFFACRHRKESVADFLTLAMEPIDVLWLVVGVGLQVVVGLPYRWLNVDTEKLAKPGKDLVQGTGGGVVAFTGFAVAVGLLAPIVEECFYRGFIARSIVRLFPAFRTWTTTMIGAVLSGIWFGVVHFEALQLPALITVGVVCAVTAIRTGRLAPAVFLHMGFNLITVFALRGDF
jgi:membrane protease YdiL (CAAX protease family)